MRAGVPGLMNKNVRGALDILPLLFGGFLAGCNGYTMAQPVYSAYSYDPGYPAHEYVPYGYAPYGYSPYGYPSYGPYLGSGSDWGWRDRDRWHRGQWREHEHNREAAPPRARHGGPQSHSPASQAHTAPQAHAAPYPTPSSPPPQHSSQSPPPGHPAEPHQPK